MNKETITTIENIVGYEFQNKALLVQAFTRESYAKEQRVKGIDCQSNEQLEYFGDSVLNYLVVCGQLDHFTKVVDETGMHVLYKEGKLSEFNSHWTDKSMLSECIDALGLAQYLIMSKGDVNQNAQANKSVKEDLFESLVGAMWIDSEKDISRIQNVVYSMLNISFENVNIEKNYVCQLVEHASKYKHNLNKTVTQIETGYKVEYAMDLELVDDESRIWTSVGYGKNIKEAEQDSAKNMIDKLTRYGFYHVNPVINVDFTLTNAINVLQELNQKGIVGEITYADENCFSSTKKPYWRVTCKVGSYITPFVGISESKKEAKKHAAFNALLFITEQASKIEEYNPENKKFKMFLDAIDHYQVLRVFVIDSSEDGVYVGRMYPENEELRLFSGNQTLCDNDKLYEFYDNPKEAFVEHMLSIYEGSNYSEEELKADLTIFINNEYEKLDNEIKNNGLKLLNTFIDLEKKYK